jgi:hypothetical protein
MAQTLRRLDQYSGTVARIAKKDGQETGFQLTLNSGELSPWLNYSQYATDVPHPAEGDTVLVMCDAGKPFIRELEIYPQAQEYDDLPPEPPDLDENPFVEINRPAEQRVSAPMSDEAAALLDKAAAVKAAQAATKPAPAFVPPALREMDQAVIRMSALKSATVLVASRLAAGDKGLGAMDVVGTAAMYEQWLRGQATFEELKDWIVNRAATAAPRKQAS